MRIIFTPAARAEILGAQDWYETQRTGLGIRFRAELQALADRMTENPYQFPVVLQDIHRARLRKFPYNLFFRIEKVSLLVIACFHGSRDPERWRERI
jgi:plasmid stabilization system protein ParE